MALGALGAIAQLESFLTKQEPVAERGPFGVQKAFRYVVRYDGDARAAVNAISRLPSTRTAAVLLTIYTDTKNGRTVVSNAEIRREYADCLFHGMRHMAGLDQSGFISALSDSDTAMTEYAADVLFDVGFSPTSHQQSIPYLIARRRWVEVSKCGPDALPFLETRLYHKDYRSEELLHTIKCIGGEPARTTLTSLMKLGDDLSQSVITVAESLSACADSTSIATLLWYIVDSTKYDAQHKVGWAGGLWDRVEALLKRCLSLDADQTTRLLLQLAEGNSPLGCCPKAVLTAVLGSAAGALPEGSERLRGDIKSVLQRLDNVSSAK